jgi:nitrate/TMAO reductase-like tetraheme cytochrome c subunit
VQERAQGRVMRWFFLILCLWLSVSIILVWRARPAQCQHAGNDYIGAHQCRGCHEADYKTWEGSAHARAFSILPEQERKNPQCLQCHSVGTAPHLQGVQCESCHGGGKYYVMPEVMVDPVLARAVGLRVVKGEKGCKDCHKGHSPKLRPFKYKEMWKKISHGRRK